MEVVIYKSRDGKAQMEVNLRDDTVWLSQSQIAILFDTDRSVITKHISNIFKSEELTSKSNVQKMHITGAFKPTNYYGLDVVISVGYRVNSQKATQFRIWATGVLKDHLLRGYSINQKLLTKQQEKLKDLQNAIYFIEDKSHQLLLKDQSLELLSLIRQYTKSLDFLEQYDKKEVREFKGTNPKTKLTYSETMGIVIEIRKKLAETKSDIGFFGVENSDRLPGIIGNLNQTFDGAELYKTAEEKAANLLYMIIKDHPFIDGNKRSGSLLFIHYLDKNNILYRKTGERKINDNALVAIALLVAISDPTEKDVLVNVIRGLIS